jgi:hypothetical protein
MNVILNPSQSDTRVGEISLLGGSDLTGKENLLLKLTNSAGTPKFALPAAVTDVALFVCMSGDVAANYTAGEAPDGNMNARVKANGTIVTGDVLVHDATSYGKVIAIPATEGLYFSPGIAEESAAAGGLVKFRPFPRMVTVGTAFSNAAPAATAPTNSSPYGFSQAQAQAILTNVIELRAFAVAQGWKATS